MTRGGCFLVCLFAALFFAVMLGTGFMGFPMMVSCSLSMMFAASVVLVAVLLGYGQAVQKKGQAHE